MKKYLYFFNSDIFTSLIIFFTNSVVGYFIKPYHECSAFYDSIAENYLTNFAKHDMLLI